MPRPVNIIHPLTLAGMGCFGLLGLLLIASHLLHWTTGKELEDFGWLGRGVTYTPLPLIFSALILIVIGQRRTRQHILKRTSRCVFCGYDRGTLATDALCPECGRSVPDAVGPEMIMPKAQQSPGPPPA